MKNYTLTAYGAPVEIVCQEEPALTGAEVLVEVTRCGICHTDVSIQKGYYDHAGRHHRRCRLAAPSLCYADRRTGWSVSRLGSPRGPL
ncbi:hypothetical protein [Bosea sp. (in: a-proteobacteria)]|uniref:hypothetical protein n=1 Tax=Bosea sp. (in: a-proteobacteria) TaxID=1871050 RepID=UPI002DDCD39C|nr:hypothetical protein [Bosea sp. (in: a-proteobacteria)]HEV2510309.1 hypothetical protein [Bosea sp. (in: a-proteobacteria)]